MSMALTVMETVMLMSGAERIPMLAVSNVPNIE